MFRTIIALTVVAIGCTSIAAISAATPATQSIDTFQPQLPTGLLAGSDKPALIQLVLPDLHFSPASNFSLPTAVATPSFAIGQVSWSSPVKDGPVSESSAFGFEHELVQHADTSPLLLSGMLNQSGLPSTNPPVMPTSFRDASATFAAPALYVPPASYLESSHQFLSR
jgi:hypothetical protein